MEIKAKVGFHSENHREILESPQTKLGNTEVRHWRLGVRDLCCTPDATWTNLTQHAMFQDYPRHRLIDTVRSFLDVAPEVVSTSPGFRAITQLLIAIFSVN